MDQQEWASAVKALADAADRTAVLSRCLAVGPHLEDWRYKRDELAGGSAADALDQAMGDLERLAGGQAAEMLRVVESLLAELPPPLE